MSRFRKGLLWTIGGLLVVALLLRLFVLKVWTIPDDPYLSASLAPTLSGGDTVIVITRGTPGFGDLVRCPDPESAGAFVVGRIAGVENDRIEVEAATLRVNDQRYAGDMACADGRIKVVHPDTKNEVELSCDVVQMGGGWHYRATGTQVLYEPKKTVTVGKGMVFLVSDNRALHDDSRDYGLLPRSACQERIAFRLWGKSGWSDSKHRMSVIH